MEKPYTPEPSRSLETRYARTLQFVLDSKGPPARVLDLGAPNPMAHRLAERGFTVFNTSGDLDLKPEVVRSFDVEIVTAFEILEHLIAPFNVVRELPGERLFATVPLRLWFASAYRSESDPWDRHFHEFEDWQFDWLLEKAGWDVVRRDKWRAPTGWLGVRPLLRRVTDRYYAVEAVRRP
jgi:hypothetical protein